MGRVTGLGGIFVKAADPDAWRTWYRDALGVAFEDWGGAVFRGPAADSTNLSAFAADSDYFAPSPHPFMINLVVDDLDGVLQRAAAAGAQPLGRQEDDFGRFAWLMDPAGVKVELWQPPAPSAA